MAAAKPKGNASMLQDPVFSTRIAQVEMELRALEITNMRVIFAEAKQQAPGPEASMLKIRGTEILQRISEMQVDLLGGEALVLGKDSGEGSRATLAYLNLRKLSIFGGSNEIQRNIIAHMILGL
jgi:alkylation response protein AidB-like acyl-CoA dehydrogenase